MLCDQIPGLEVVKAFDSPQRLLAEIAGLDFDLVISDIEMPGMDGLTLASKLKNKLIIFTTAYKDFAVEAFDIDAVDYVTKPVKLERLHKAVEKAIERHNKPKPKLSALFNTDKGKAMLQFSQMVLIRTATTDSRDKEVLLKDGKIMLLKNINFEQLLKELPEPDVCRINKKEILAMQAVRFFSHDEITLLFSDENGKPITVNLSEKFRPEFLLKSKT